MNTLDSTFNNAKKLFENTINKVDGLMQNQTGRISLFLMLLVFLYLLFMIVYYKLN